MSFHTDCDEDDAMKAPLPPLALLLRTLPDSVHTELLARLFSHLLKGQPLAAQLTELEGKRIAIAITDCGNELRFLIHEGKLARAPGKPWDVRIRGKLEEFWLLASRAEDPDTLFFHRRLAIEGDTATGLHIKNLLDSLEFDWRAHVAAVAGPRLAPLVTRGVERLQLQRRMQFSLHR
ncbi:MAG TPA: SCP2 sterol-binding domain-containing protein [Gammaproteobacteria bacterium]